MPEPMSGTGSGYKVRVTDMYDESESDCSDEFYLVASSDALIAGDADGPSIEVTSPSLNDVAEAGDEYTVEVSTLMLQPAPCFRRFMSQDPSKRWNGRTNLFGSKSLRKAWLFDNLKVQGEASPANLILVRRVLLRVFAAGVRKPKSRVVSAAAFVVIEHIAGCAESLPPSGYNS